MSHEDLSQLGTEARNPRSEQLDAMSTLEVVTAMNDEDRLVADAVRAQLPQIAAAVDAIAQRMRDGGRLIYVGAGTSGRLGVLDAAECPPTFSADPSQVLGLIAGGERALLAAVEGAEDDPELAAAELDGIGLAAGDAVVGIAASGRTPYVIGALERARAVGALRVAVTMNPGSVLARGCEHAVEVACGAEVLTGSTRLKAGTATKLVLNMLTTGAFVRLHKVYGNLMVDLQATNEKLRARSVRIVAAACGCDLDEARAQLQAAEGEVKVAIVARCRDLAPATARALLGTHEGSVRAALAASERPS
ncbi:MAG: N-acetylmuramic acid 6-phosphate etherase [Planctomycetota bacterium]|nr:N-acetylmuramic acid 6-phosphate etherase [Planctomycetota bacterium]